MQTTTSKPRDPLSFKRSCAKCAHLNICTLNRAVAPLLSNWEEGHRPFEATDLAAVCLEYLATETVETANL